MLKQEVTIEDGTGSKGQPAGVLLLNNIVKHWRALLLGVAVLLLYFPVLRVLARQCWDDPNYSHGFLVPLFCAYVLWERRRELSEVTPKPTSAGLVVLLGSIVVLFLGSLGAELFLARVSLLGVIIGLLLFLHGWAMVKKMVFPLSALLLMIPIPGVIYYQLVFPLQLLASELAAAALQASHLVPVFREGNVLVLPGVRLEVAEACSGIRSLMSLLTIAVIYGYLSETKTWARWLLCLLIVPIAVLSNSARVFFAAIGSQYIGMSAVEGVSHFLAGIFLFLVAIMMLMACHGLLRAVVRWRSGEERAK
ncbi:MAG: exosortase/archaeosortase family protein [Candidatus Korobacteraceae bacterium]